MMNVLADGNGHKWGLVCGYSRAGTTARLCRSGVPNLSSLYTFSILSSIILWVLVTISSNFKINEVTSRFSDILNIMSQTKVSNKY